MIQYVFPLHDYNFNTRLISMSRRLNPYFGPGKDEFLLRVRHQFGEKVAFEYAFNIFYTQARPRATLVLPSSSDGTLHMWYCEKGSS